MNKASQMFIVFIRRFTSLSLKLKSLNEPEVHLLLLNIDLGRFRFNAFTKPQNFDKNIFLTMLEATIYENQ